MKTKKSAAERFGEFVGTSIIVIIFLMLGAVCLAITWKALSWAFGL